MAEEKPSIISKDKIFSGKIPVAGVFPLLLYATKRIDLYPFLWYSTTIVLTWQDGGIGMVLTLKILLVIFSIGLIGVVLLQSGKSAGLSGSIGGGAEQMLGKQKARGIDAVLNKITVGLAVGFMILAIAVAFVTK